MCVVQLGGCDWVNIHFTLLQTKQKKVHINKSDWDSWPRDQPSLWTLWFTFYDLIFFFCSTYVLIETRSVYKFSSVPRLWRCDVCTHYVRGEWWWLAGTPSIPFRRSMRYKLIQPCIRYCQVVLWLYFPEKKKEYCAKRKSNDSRDLKRL